MQSGQFNRPVPSTDFQAQYQFDPVLNKLQALSEQSIANARTDAATAKKQALIDAGSQELARNYGADENTINAAGANAFGTSQLLAKDFGDRQRQMDEYLNANNLFYSGERVRQMGELERGRAQAETDFNQKIRDLMSNIDAQLQAAEEAEIMRQLEAQAQAGYGGGAVPGMYGAGGSGGVGAPVPGAVPEPLESAPIIEPVPQYAQPTLPRYYRNGPTYNPEWPY